MCLCTALQAEAQHSKTSWHAVSRVFRYIHPEVNATHYCADTQTNTHTLQTTSAWMTLIFLRSFFSTLPHIYFLALRFLQRVKTHWAVFRVCVSQHPSALFASWHFFFLFVPLFFTGKNPKTDSDRKTAVHVFMRMDASESFKQEVICRYKQLSSILAHSHPAWHPLNFKLLCVFTYSNPKSSPRSSVCSSSTKDLVDFAVKFTVKIPYWSH